MLIREELERIVGKALQSALDDSSLALDEVPDCGLERPRDEGHGDWASTLAMRAAKSAGMNPREIAQIIIDHLPKDSIIASCEIAGPGFINFSLTNEALQGVISEIRRSGGDFGKGTIPEGMRKVNIEYISANPTGPFHVGHGRWAALGDATARVMRHAGYDVFEEFYINDNGNQMDVFAESVVVRYLQLLGQDIELPEQCYAGAYVIDIAQTIIDEDGDKWLHADEQERLMNFRERAYSFELAEQHRICDEFGTTFDEWFSERTLYEVDYTGKSAIDKALDAMDASGYLYEKDGALWFRSTDFKDDKDRVLRKSDGSYTYFMSDVAYHYNKMQRGFDHLIDIWGADHHGYIARCQAMLSAWGYDGALEIMLGQLVNLFRDGKPVRMSKRTGEMVTFEELMDEVGVDATRWIMLSRSADQMVDFDIELAKKQDATNPVYYVQYAHARICSILRKAAEEQGLGSLESGDFNDLVDKIIGEDPDLSLLTHESEFALMRKMDVFPELVEQAARDRVAYRFTHYTQELASLFHGFYTNCHVITDDSALTQARLALCDATRRVLALSLSLLGISAPERM
ncbi:MAG: arginine--tRNA ligase [Eggerthellaceae bacterium]|nr:arginine--tRNA ligase [Eggerthellaceae bacterium]